MSFARHFLSFPPLMADSIIEQAKLLLPWELRFHIYSLTLSILIENVRDILPYELRSQIYSLTFFVDLEHIQWLQKQRNFVRECGIPTREGFLLNPKYQKYREKEQLKGVESTWPDPVEEAFFEGKTLLTTI